MSYVRLKHALAGIALDVIAHPDHAPLAASLAAFGRMSGRGDSIPLADLAHATGLTAEEVRRLLRGTGLFNLTGGTRSVALDAALRPFAPYLRRQTARLEEALARLRSSDASGVPREIWRGAVLFNAGLFFECHEYLEDVWRAAAPPERAFYHSLVQAAAGCYHLEKGNRHGARTLIAKAIAKLEAYTPLYLGVDTLALLTGLRSLLAAVNASPPRSLQSRVDLPMIRLVPQSERASR